MAGGITHTMPDTQSIICLGDSITAGYHDEDGLGWVARLSQKLAQQYGLKYRALNAGISGDTTVDAWHNIISNVLHQEPDFLITLTGTNDLCIREGVSPESHQQPHCDRMNDWNRISDLVNKLEIPTLVVAPLPLEQDIVRFAAHDDRIDGHTTFRWEQKDVLAYNDALEKHCAKEGLNFLRVYEAWQSAGLDTLFTDGLHPNAKGHELLASQVFEKINALGWTS